MKIALAVQGRFYAFDLARSLIRQGHQVRVLTNYPVWATRRFGLDKDVVRSFWLQGIASRITYRLAGMAPSLDVSPLMHRLFGRWVAAQIAKEEWDVVQIFSGVAEEALVSKRKGRELRVLVRASAHIRTQDRLLAEEERRSGHVVERPRPWLIAKEEREYALCDRIVVLSTFTYQSFLDHGIAQEKLLLLPLGVDTRHFRATSELISERCRRILAGEPLRVLFVGTLSYRKGALDFLATARALDKSRFQFRFVGDVPPEAAQLIPEMAGHVELIPRQPQAQLPQWYSWADVFMFPTIEDGFPVVLAQANANALPILTTPNCSGPDLVHEGQTGWVLPIRQPQAFIERLQDCDQNRPALVEMIQRIHNVFQPRDWDAVAEEFIHLCVGSLVC